MTFRERWDSFLPPGKTYTGLEVITPHIKNYASDLRVIQPTIIKTRWARADFLLQLHNLCPDAIFLTRPESEGLNRNEIARGYRDMEAAMRQAGLIDRWVAHEISNEPNHEDHNLDALAYEVEAREGLYLISDRIVPLGTGGYQRYNNVEKYATVGNRLPCIDWRGWHMYFQVDGPAAGVADALTQIGNGDIRYSICTEANAGRAWPGGETEEQRLPLAKTAYQLMADQGAPAIIYFALDSWSGGPEFAYSREGVVALLTSIKSAPMPKPRRKKVPKYSFGGGFKEWVDSHPDANVGSPTGAEKWVKQDVLRIQTTEDSDGTPGALFWFVGDPVGTRFIKKGYPM